jgi:hypothetical protein
MTGHGRIIDLAVMAVLVSLSGLSACAPSSAAPQPSPLPSPRASATAPTTASAIALSPATATAAAGTPTPTLTGTPSATGTTASGTVVVIGTGIANAGVTPTSSSVATSTQSGSAGAAQRAVTLADDGQTIRLRVGERFLLNLGEGYDWTVDVDDQSIVSRVVNVLTVRGSQGLFEAHRPGSTTLRALGDLPCRQAKPPCMVPTRVFRLQIVVQ